MISYGLFLWNGSNWHQHLLGVSLVGVLASNLLLEEGLGLLLSTLGLVAALLGVDGSDDAYGNKATDSDPEPWESTLIIFLVV